MPESSGDVNIGADLPPLHNLAQCLVEAECCQERVNLQLPDDNRLILSLSLDPDLTILNQPSVFKAGLPFHPWSFSLPSPLLPCHVYQPLLDHSGLSGYLPVARLRGSLLVG